MKTSPQHYSRDLARYYRLPATQISLTVVLSLFIVAIFLVFALGPTAVAITTLQRTITESRDTLSQLEAKIASLEQVTTRLETLKPLLPTLNLSIPNTSATLGPLTQSLEGLAAQTGVELQSESVGPTLLYSRILSPFTPNKKQTVIALPLTMRVVGNYPNVSSFLSQVLSMERIIAIDLVTITRETNSQSGNTIVALTMSGSAYYLVDEAQLNKALPDKKGGR